jgi:hypothetical protein
VPRSGPDRSSQRGSQKHYGQIAKSRPDWPSASTIGCISTFTKLMSEAREERQPRQKEAA